MKKTLVVLGLVVVMFLGVSYTYARGPGFGAGKGPGVGPGSGNCPGLGGASNLTSEQQTQMRDLQQKHYNEMAPLREKMYSLRQEIRTLWADPKTDPNVIQDTERQMSKLRDQTRDKGIQFRLEARNLLTPDQISAFGAGCGKGGRGGACGGSGRGCN
jgi:Spy/CpxP family protein refolding chaperone